MPACPACSHATAAEARFCQNCGTALGQPGPTSKAGAVANESLWTCQRCGSGLQSGWEYCSCCGRIQRMTFWNRVSERLGIMLAIFIPLWMVLAIRTNSPNPVEAVRIILRDWLGIH